MLTFPVDYTFNVVARTSGDEETQEQFVAQVKSIIGKATATNADDAVCRITPRGKNFTKVIVQVQVESADVIASIYYELGELELSVMQF